MQYEVTPWTNFCRVFELPTEFSSEFCFGGGIPTNFQMVDWFHPVPSMPVPAVPPEEWEKHQPLPDPSHVDGDIHIEYLFEFLRGKPYVKPGRTYLVICNFGLAFIFTHDKMCSFFNSE